jgi:hypothetical protein
MDRSAAPARGDESDVRIELARVSLFVSISIILRCIGNDISDPPQLPLAVDTAASSPLR